MSTQFAPPVSHRRQRYAKLIGAVPDHVPAEPVRTCPDFAVPEIVGTAVFAGGMGTSAVAAESAVADPAAFVAVTRKRILCSPSFAVIV